MKATPVVANIRIINNKTNGNDSPTIAARALASKPHNCRSRKFVIHLLSIVSFALYVTLVVTTSAMSTTDGSSGSSSHPSAAAPPSDTATSELARSTIDFLTVARGLKTTPRTGWIRQKAGPRIESVADHSWRMSLMAMVASSSANAASGGGSASTRYDTNRCIKIALVHDLAEATVGDITPHCGVSDATKHDLELAAITSMTSRLVPGSSDDGTAAAATSEVAFEILELWKEYEAGATPEAKLVKDMDKLEMILQALEYESDGKNEESLDGFFDSTRDKWRTSIGRAWGEEINKRRPKHQAQPTGTKLDGTSES